MKKQMIIAIIGLVAIVVTGCVNNQSHQVSKVTAKSLGKVSSRYQPFLPEGLISETFGVTVVENRAEKVSGRIPSDCIDVLLRGNDPDKMRASGVADPVFDYEETLSIRHNIGQFEAADEQQRLNSFYNVVQDYMEKKGYPQRSVEINLEFYGYACPAPVPESGVKVDYNCAFEAQPSFTVKDGKKVLYEKSLHVGQRIYSNEEYALVRAYRAMELSKIHPLFSSEVIRTVNTRLYGEEASADKRGVKITIKILPPTKFR